ncbi:MAG: hypothetical protein Q9204_002676 [Flavoplaca sp. TL-2023a]
MPEDFFTMKCERPPSTNASVSACRDLILVISSKPIKSTDTEVHALLNAPWQNASIRMCLDENIELF